MTITYRGGEGFTQSQCLFSDLKKLWADEEWGAKNGRAVLLLFTLIVFAHVLPASPNCLISRNY
ncbi:hypothetical protein [Richelia intracellularis]|uniref:hypothetical protein n=1 Tax=Richelia intracellularis TaxID=1164990 RepID=UPI0003458E8D|nr:hypothetical protein [Richelia intracellularis]